jgi:hypothetical protein
MCEVGVVASVYTCWRTALIDGNLPARAIAASAVEIDQAPSAYSENWVTHDEQDIFVSFAL